ncbi:MAG: hypothetical protein E7497_03110 [Ruminococcus sp.]|nr:hypothetical protein [Ruminococcus sp.]
MKKIILDKASAKLTGRTLVRDGILKLVMSASGCEFNFTGKKLILSAGCDSDCLNDGKECNFPRMAVLVNGKFAVKKVICKERESFVICDSESTVSLNVRIIKLSEAAFSVLEIHPAETDDCAVIETVPEKSLKIEFIGDSITCGYGVDDANIESEFATAAENAMKSYAYLTAKALDADYSMFSASGYGIISGYTPDGTRNLPERIPPFYDSSGFSYSTVDGTLHPHDIAWDFKSFTPNAVVINLGTNDSSFCKGSDERSAEFEAAYYEFVSRVRSHYPDAHIICALGIMETVLIPQVRRACEKLAADTADDKLHFLEFKTQDGTLGYASKWHPTEDTHAESAQRLVEYLKEILK